MPYSLGEAARATGKNKTTIARAIASGKLSATRNSDGSYSIDPAELARVFPFDPATSSAPVATQQSATEGATPNELATLRERVAQLEVMNDELRTQRDQWHDQAERLTRLLAAPKDATPQPVAPVEQPAAQPTESPAQPTARPWWRRIFGE